MFVIRNPFVSPLFLARNNPKKNLLPAERDSRPLLRLLLFLLHPPLISCCSSLLRPPFLLHACFLPFLGPLRPVFFCSLSLSLSPCLSLFLSLFFFLSFCGSQAFIFQFASFPLYFFCLLLLRLPGLYLPIRVLFLSIFSAFSLCLSLSLFICDFLLLLLLLLLPPPPLL